MLRTTMHAMVVTWVISFGLHVHAMDDENAGDNSITHLLTQNSDYFKQIIFEHVYKNPTKAELCATGFSSFDGAPLLVLYDSDTYEQNQEQLHRLEDNPLCAAYAPCGNILAVGTSNGRVQLRSGAKDILEKKYTTHVRSLQWSKDGMLLAAGLQGDEISQLLLLDGKTLETRCTINNVYPCTCLYPSTSDPLFVRCGQTQAISRPAVQKLLTGKQADVDAIENDKCVFKWDPSLGTVKQLCANECATAIAAITEAEKIDAFRRIITTTNVVFFSMNQRCSNPIASMVHQDGQRYQCKMDYAKHAGRFILFNTKGRLKLFNNAGELVNKAMTSPASDFAIVDDTQRSVSVVVAARNGSFERITIDARAKK